MTTIRLKKMRNWDYWIGEGIRLCKFALPKAWIIPSTAKILWLTAHKVDGPERIKVAVEKYDCPCSTCMNTRDVRFANESVCVRTSILGPFADVKSFYVQCQYEE